MISLLVLLAGLTAVYAQGLAPRTRCVFSAMQRLECEIDEPAKEMYNCTVCAYSGLQDSPCPSLSNRNGGCPVNTDLCEFSCINKQMLCLETHWLIFDKLNLDTGEISTSCKVVDTQFLVKPGPVRDLKVTAFNSTTVVIRFGKPASREAKDLYKYIVKYTRNHTGAQPRRRMLKKRSDYQVETTLYDLLPGRNYSISVYARPRKKGYRSEPVTRRVVTPPDVPLVGPAIPSGGFAVDEDLLMVYWEEVPEDKRHGWISRYDIAMDGCDHRVNTSSDQYWTLVNLTSCFEENIEVKTSAATTVGWSRTPSVYHINPQLYSVNQVTEVYKTEEELVWSFPTYKSADSFSVFSCFGNMDSVSSRLVDCKTPIEKIVVSADNRSMSLLKRPAPQVGCSLCEWHFGVSVNIAGTGAGIRWNAPIIGVPEVVTEAGLRTITIVALVMGCALVVIVVIILCGLTRHKKFCKKIVILVPEIQTHEMLKEESFISLGTTNGQSPKESEMDRPLLQYKRDSGNSSMTTIRHEETKRLTSMTEEDKEMEAERVPDRVWSCSHGDEDWSSGDSSAVSEYRQVAGSQTGGNLPAMYSDLRADNSASSSGSGSSASTTDTSAPTESSVPIESSRSSAPAIELFQSSAPTIEDSSATITDSLVPNNQTSSSHTRTSDVKCLPAEVKPRDFEHNDDKRTFEDNVPESLGVDALGTGEKLLVKSVPSETQSGKTDTSVLKQPTWVKLKDKQNRLSGGSDTETSVGSYSEVHCDPV